MDLWPFVKNALQSEKWVFLWGNPLLGLFPPKHAVQDQISPELSVSRTRAFNFCDRTKVYAKLTVLSAGSPLSWRRRSSCEACLDVAGKPQQCAFNSFCAQRHAGQLGNGFGGKALTVVKP